MKKYTRSYDHECARKLAEKLGAGRSSVSLPRAGISPAVPNATPIHEMPPTIGFGSSEHYRDHVWHKLLEWARGVTESEGGFVCDGSGLSIAVAGEVPQSMVDYPSVLVSVFSSLARHTAARSAPRVVLIEVENRWITALVPRDGEDLMVVLMGEICPRPEVIDCVRAVFSEKMMDL